MSYKYNYIPLSKLSKNKRDIDYSFRIDLNHYEKVIQAKYERGLLNIPTDLLLRNAEIIEGKKRGVVNSISKDEVEEGDVVEYSREKKGLVTRNDAGILGIYSGTQFNYINHGINRINIYKIIYKGTYAQILGDKFLY